MRVCFPSLEPINSWTKTFDFLFFDKVWLIQVLKSLIKFIITRTDFLNLNLLHSLINANRFDRAFIVIGFFDAKRRLRNVIGARPCRCLWSGHVDLSRNFGGKKERIFLLFFIFNGIIHRGHARILKSIITSRDNHIFQLIILIISGFKRVIFMFQKLFQLTWRVFGSFERTERSYDFRISLTKLLKNYYYPGPGLAEFALPANRIVFDLNATDSDGVS